MEDDGGRGVRTYNKFGNHHKWPIQDTAAPVGDNRTRGYGNRWIWVHVDREGEIDPAETVAP